MPDAELLANLEAYRARAVDVSGAGRDRAVTFATPPWWAEFDRAEDYDGRIAELTANLAASSADRERLDHALRAQSDEHGRINRELGAAQARVSALETSRTWRWTKVVRRFVDLVGGSGR
jgi:hypothetical protein